MDEHYIKKVFPQIKLIQNPSIQQKVVKTFLKAAELGKWDTFDGIPFTLLIDTDVTFAEHTKAVCDMAMKLGDTMQHFVTITMDYLIAGGLLHDVGKLLEYERKKTVVKSRHGHLVRHPVSGAVIAAEQGLPLEVIHIIVAHSKEGDAIKRTPEAIIVHHCDFVHFESLKG